MSIVINTNLAAMQAQNAINASGAKLNQSMLRLSTGLRINSAKDDPAGYYMAMKVNSQLRGTTVAYQNVASAVNMVTTAESDLGMINDQLLRIKELAMQYSNDSSTAEEKSAIKLEVQQRLDEINRITEESKFNDLKLLDGSKDGARIQVGSNSDASTNAININGVFLNASTGKDGLALIGADCTYANLDAAFADADTAAAFADLVEDASDVVTERVATAGVYNSRLTSIADHLVSKNETLTSTYSSIMDADISAETANYVQQQIIQQTAASMLSQANTASATLALKLIESM